LTLILTSLGTNLFVKVPRPGDSEGPFRSSSQAATCYYQFNHSKIEAIPLSALPQQANLPAYLHTNPFKCWTSSREAV